MPIPVQGNSASGTFDGTNTNVVVTLSAIGSGNTVIGGWGTTSGNPVTIISLSDDQSNSYNQETSVGTGTNQIGAFSRTNVTNGPTTFTLTIAGVQNIVLVVEEYSGTNTASTDQRDGSAHGGQTQASPGTGANGVTSGSVTTTTNGDLLWCITGNNTALGNATLTAGSTLNATYTAGTTVTFTAFSNMQLNVEWAVQSAAGSGTAGSWTQSQNDPRETILIAIKPAAGGGAVATKGTMSMMGVG